MQPSVVNDVVLVGGPSSLIALDKGTGSILEEWAPLDAYFQAGIAVVDDYVLFGTGYAGAKNGSFHVWKLGA